jgi:N-acetylglucosaminyl-diphospho-decaprenol L-rhamnosyltransferase
MSTRVAIIIVTWNSAEDIRRCLLSLRSQNQDIELQVVVVDNASIDGTAGVVADFPTVKFIQNAVNRGFAYACNQGARHIDSPWILLLNPDTELPAGAIGRWVEAVERVPGVGVSGPRLLNGDGSLQPSVRRLPGSATLSTLLLKLHRVIPGLLGSYMCKDFDYDQAGSVEQVMGAFSTAP